MINKKIKITFGILLLVLTFNLVSSLEVGGGIGISINIIGVNETLPNNSSQENVNIEDEEDEENEDDDEEEDEQENTGFNEKDFEEEFIEEETILEEGIKLNSFEKSKRNLMSLLSMNFVLLCILLFFIRNPKIKVVNKK